MGTAGNRTGYKVYSINTTIRNPKRNLDFLNTFVGFEGIPFDSDAKVKYLELCVRDGIYQFKKIDNSLKDKILNNVPLNTDEIRIAFEDNPQATGFSNRVVTQLRSLKDQGFIQFDSSKDKMKLPIYRFTNLGKKLLDKNNLSTDVYSIAMIALHGKSPIRTTILNESRPFLNTLFVIYEVGKLLAQKGVETKGILTHEFAAFVLSMKDCDYKKAAQRIISYREKFGLKENEAYITDFCFVKEGLLPLNYNTLMVDYVDDVFRKFEMTGLLRKRGAYKNTYIDFSIQNLKKINQILEAFVDYIWINFKSEKDFYDYVDSIKLPWQIDVNSRKEVLIDKAKVLGVSLNFSQTLDEVEAYLNSLSGKNAINNQMSKYSLEQLYREMLILAGEINEKSIMDDLSEPLRLEFLIGLLLGKKYNPSFVVSNLLYNDDGEPLSFAPSRKADILFDGEGLSIVIEATMIRARNQQLNSETTNLTRHLEDVELQTQRKFSLTLIAPYVHRDTLDYFRYIATSLDFSVCPLSISRLLEIIQISDNPGEFKSFFENNVELLKKNKNINHLTDFINQKYLALKIEPQLMDIFQERLPLFVKLEKNITDGLIKPIEKNT